MPASNWIGATIPNGYPKTAQLRGRQVQNLVSQTSPNGDPDNSGVAHARRPAHSEGRVSSRNRTGPPYPPEVKPWFKPWGSFALCYLSIKDDRLISAVSLYGDHAVSSSSLIGDRSDEQKRCRWLDSRAALLPCPNDGRSR